MRKVAVFGLGKFGGSVATSLYEKGVDVLAVDKDIDIVNEFKDQVTDAVSFDGTIRENLNEIEISHMDCVVVAIGEDFESSVLITQLCKESGVSKVIAKALTEQQGKVLQLVGADSVVYPEEEMGERLAEHLTHESVVDFVELPEGFSLRKLKLPVEWNQKTIGELELMKKKMNLVQVEREGGKKYPLPTGEFLLEAGDIMDVIAPDSVLDQYI
jgi:trk system potassium uptake protein